MHARVVSERVALRSPSNVYIYVARGSQSCSKMSLRAKILAVLKSSIPIEHVAAVRKQPKLKEKVLIQVARNRTINTYSVIESIRVCVCACVCKAVSVCVHAKP
jgi:hypothetical protein